MKSAGQVIRNIRKSRGYTLKQLSDGITSYSTLAAFERGESQLAFEVLVEILDKLNITLGEFSRYMNKPATAFYKWLWKIQDLFDARELEELKMELELLESKSQVKSGKCQILILKNFINMLDKSIYIDDEETKFIKDYFWDIDEWGEFDIVFFRSTSHKLNNDSLMSLSLEILRLIEEELLPNNYGANQYIGAILISVHLFYERKEYDDCRILVRKVEPLIPSQNLFELTRLEGFKNILNYRENPKLIYIDNLKKILDYAQYVDDNYLYEALYHLYEGLFEDNGGIPQIPDFE